LKKYDVCCTCTFGLESVVKKELKDMGFEVTSTRDGQVHTLATSSQIIWLNMSLRSCDRVLILIGEKKVTTFDELFEFANSLNWDDYLDKRATFDVTKVSLVKSKLMSGPDCQRITKKAVAEKLKSAYRLFTLPMDGAYYPIFLKIHNDLASFYLNTSGDGLNRRGYRSKANQAPIKETLAAGIVLLSDYERTKQFSDVCCGSGTFVIEAAMIAKNILPGASRSFQIESWGYTRDKERLILNEKANDEIISDDIVRLVGSDIDKNCINIANQNAINAKVDQYVSFQKQDLKDFRSRKKCGVMIVNPPYGVRLGEKKDNFRLYEDLGKLFDTLESWQLVSICSDENFTKAFNHRYYKNRKIFNGNIKSYLYFYKNDTVEEEQ